MFRNRFQKAYEMREIDRYKKYSRNCTVLISEEFSTFVIMNTRGKGTKKISTISVKPISTFYCKLWRFVFEIANEF